MMKPSEALDRYRDDIKRLVAEHRCKEESEECITETKLTDGDAQQ